MTEKQYSYTINYGVPHFYKNGEHMTSREVLNELEVNQMLLNQWIDECSQLREENEQLAEICENLVNADANREHRLKQRIEELEKENEQLRREKGKQEEEIEILSETLATKRNTNEVYKKRILELEKQITDWETSYDLLKQQIKENKQ